MNEIIENALQSSSEEAIRCISDSQGVFNATKAELDVANGELSQARDEVDRCQGKLDHAAGKLQKARAGVRGLCCPDGKRLLFI